MVYTLGPYMQVKVHVEVVNPSTGEVHTTNIFHCTFSSKGIDVASVMPKTYGGKMTVTFFCKHQLNLPCFEHKRKWIYILNNLLRASKYDRHPYKHKSLSVCYLMTPGLIEEIQCHVWPYSFSLIANHQSRHKATSKMDCQPGYRR